MFLSHENRKIMLFCLLLFYFNGFPAGSVRPFDPKQLRTFNPDVEDKDDPVRLQRQSCFFFTDSVRCSFELTLKVQEAILENDS